MKQFAAKYTWKVFFAVTFLWLISKIALALIPEGWAQQALDQELKSLGIESFSYAEIAPALLGLHLVQTEMKHPAFSMRAAKVGLYIEVWDSIISLKLKSRLELKNASLKINPVNLSSRNSSLKSDFQKFPVSRIIFEGSLESAVLLGGILTQPVLKNFKADIINHGTKYHVAFDQKDEKNSDIILTSKLVFKQDLSLESIKANVTSLFWKRLRGDLSQLSGVLPNTDIVYEKDKVELLFEQINFTTLVQAQGVRLLLLLDQNKWVMQNFGYDSFPGELKLSKVVLNSRFQPSAIEGRARVNLSLVQELLPAGIELFGDLGLLLTWSKNSLYSEAYSEAINVRYNGVAIYQAQKLLIQLVNKLLKVRKHKAQVMSQNIEWSGDFNQDLNRVNFQTFSMIDIEKLIPVLQKFPATGARENKKKTQVIGTLRGVKYGPLQFEKGKVERVGNRWSFSFKKPGRITGVLKKVSGRSRLSFASRDFFVRDLVPKASPDLNLKVRLKESWFEPSNGTGKFHIDLRPQQHRVNAFRSLLPEFLGEPLKSRLYNPQILGGFLEIELNKKADYLLSLETDSYNVELAGLWMSPQECSMKGSALLKKSILQFIPNPMLILLPPVTSNGEIKIPVSCYGQFNDRTSWSLVD